MLTLLAETTGESALSALLGAAGPTGAVIYLVTKFLSDRRLDAADRERDAQANRDAHKSLVDRVEKIAEQFTVSQKEIATEFRAEHRQSVDGMVQLNRETVGAMTAMSERVNDQGAAVGELRSEFQKFGTVVGELKTEMHSLSQAVASLGGKITVGG